MSESIAKTEKPVAAAMPPGPETQKQRWMKYGANVALVSVVVVLLAVIFTALAQQSWAKLHVDTTAMGLHSLKPQTKGVLRDLKQDVRIVSLYSRPQPRRGEQEPELDLATPVADLLAEYARYGGGRITTEVIDPTLDTGKVEALINDVAARYGGEVKQYTDFLEGYRTRGEAFQKLLAEEVAAAGAVTQGGAGESQLGGWVQAVSEQLGQLRERLANVDKRVARLLERKPPDYKGAVNQVRQAMEEVSGFAAAVPERFAEAKDDPAATEAARTYAAKSPARFAEIRKGADAFVEEITKLGDLKLDDLRQTLQVPDGIVVMGPNDMRVLAAEQVWQNDPNLRRLLDTPDAELKPRFAGEQQITSAILALTQTSKPKVAFVRGGGPPLAEAGSMFARGGPLSQAAARLREYNFDVVEKDLSGMWAMQAQMSGGGMPPPPEPSDEEIKGAIWIVLAMPPQGGGPMGPPPSIGPRVAEHLKAGGSAMVLVMPQAEDLTSVLADWGIRPRPEAMIVHEPVAAGDGAPGDMINEAQKNPVIFITSEYGAHMLADPIRSLDMPLIQAVPVQTSNAAGVKQWPLVPVPDEPRSWGETAAAGMGDERQEVAFDPAADIAGPLYAGAAAEREAGGTRLVVLGTLQSFTNDILNFPDIELLRRGVPAIRFPGSGELFNNSIFWLAKMEPMIAISPAAMDVSRIEKMSPRAQTFWRNFVLLAGLPLLVLIAGGLMYVRRRD